MTNTKAAKLETRESAPVDQKVYDLAEAFMEDENVSGKAASRATQQLAEQIQQTIEDFTQTLQESGGWVCDYCSKDCRGTNGTANRKCRDIHNAL